MIYLILGVLVIVAAAIFITGIFNGTRLALDNRKKRLIESERTLNAVEKRLRAIANNTSGNVELDAQLGLDEITAYHEKDD